MRFDDYFRWLVTLFLVAGAAAVLTMAILMPGCATVGPPDPEIEVVEEQAGCEEACANMQRLSYPGWDGSPGPDRERGTEDDVSCVQICVEVETTGEGFTWNTSCIAGAQSVEAVDDCAGE